MNKDFKLDDIVMMKKKHPCGNALFRVVRVGADVKIKCEQCNRTIMLTRMEFRKRMKKNVTEESR